jgi:hypothetical protein
MANMNFLVYSKKKLTTAIGGYRINDGYPKGKNTAASIYFGGKDQRWQK